MAELTMSRAYIRLDPAFFERKMLDQGYTPAEGMALIGALCLAEQQIPRGRFRNAAVLKALLGQYGRYVSALIARGDLVAELTGRLYIDGWEEWQEGDVTVRDRMARIRNRTHRDGGDRNIDRNQTVPPLSGAESGERSGALQAGATEDERWTAPEFESLAWLWAHKCLIREGDGYHQRLIHAVDRHGAPALIAEFERLSKAGTRDGDLKGFLFVGVDALDKASRPKLADLEEQDRQAERDADWQRRLEATKRRSAELRGEAT